MAKPKKLRRSKPAAPPPERTFSQAELNDAIDRDRVQGFMKFVRTMPPNDRVAFGGSFARTVVRVLERAGY